MNDARRLTTAAAADDVTAASPAPGVVFPGARILVVEDEPVSRHLLEYLLTSAGYHDLHVVADAAAAAAAFVRISPDLVLTDLRLPDGDGMELVRSLRRAAPPGEYLPIIMITADMTAAVRQEALASGALDFITKPFDPEEVLLRIRNLLHTRLLYCDVQRKARQLEDVLRVRTEELDQARLEVLQRLARAADFRDDATGDHSRRVGIQAERIARRLGLDDTAAGELGRAAMLHDIGKIGVPDGILLKPDALTPGELAVVRQHTVIGREILSGSASPLLQLAAVIAHTHHERWDGAGYHGMRGEEIPLPGRIVAVADAFDVMVNDRPYRRGVPPAEALEVVRDHSGTQFDPQVVQAFLRTVTDEVAE
jgi:putative two-component system response regulator